MTLDEYKSFVLSVTSKESMDLGAMIDRLSQLNVHENLNPSLLMTSSIGLASEGGEFAEIVKKMVYQGKPFNEDNRFHMKREMGDIIFYWMMACEALGYSPQEIIDENFNKLSNRYPEGFSVDRSENRKADDL